DFELDWDDALDDWERDVESGAVAKSGPMPQGGPAAAPKPPPAPVRALYQPPDASEIAKMRGARPAPSPPIVSKAATPTAPPPAGNDLFDLDEDDGATRVANIPRDLIDKIVAGSS